MANVYYTCPKCNKKLADYLGNCLHCAKKNKQIEVCFSMNDIQDMMSQVHKGEEWFATWTFETEEGESIDVKIVLGDRGEDYISN